MLPKNNAGALKPAHRKEKLCVKQKGKSWLEFSCSVRIATAKVPTFCLKEVSPTEIIGLWRPSVGPI